MFKVDDIKNIVKIIEIKGELLRNNPQLKTILLVNKIFTVL